MDVQSDCQESVTITFEWTLRGLKNLFDSSKGESKSKVTKSPKFSAGRWQILFYANAGVPKDGTTEGGCISLYLSCEPTVEEREAAISDSGRWVRDGVYKFTFELRNIGKNVLYNTKEASNHVFSHKTANWGWAQFARRDAVYYQANSAKANDAFVILCIITSAPAPPVPPSSRPRQLVPVELVTTVGSLLDDPTYSDVEFIIPRRGRPPRSIFASRQMLDRTEYFDNMFNSGFAEGSSSPKSPETSSSFTGSENLVIHEFDDSDNDDDADDRELSPIDESLSPIHQPSSLEASVATITESPTKEDTVDEDNVTIEEARIVHPQSSLPPSPRSPSIVPCHRDSGVAFTQPKRRVFVKDFAYATYYAVLFYLYTDTIVFAPLSSSFNTKSRIQTPSTQSSGYTTASEQQGPASSSKRVSQQEMPARRRDWIRECHSAHPNRPEPCSAKSVYRLADLMGLQELKERASQHILKSLTVDNIAFEVFSPFAAAFSEIRRAQVDFFLKHWKDIRSSDAMRNVWKQIRNGRHPGFEEVWPVIASSLEFVPPSSNDEQSAAGGDR